MILDTFKYDSLSLSFAFFLRINSRKNEMIFSLYAQIYCIHHQEKNPSPILSFIRFRKKRKNMLTALLVIPSRQWGSRIFRFKPYCSTANTRRCLAECHTLNSHVVGRMIYFICCMSSLVYCPSDGTLRFYQITATTTTTKPTPPTATTVAAKSSFSYRIRPKYVYML